MNLSTIGNDALAVLKAVAPKLALAIGGPFGPLASIAISTALGTLDKNGKPDPVATQAALVNATPEQLIALKNSDHDFMEKMADIGVTEDKLVYDDRANARAREIAVKDNTPKILAYMVVGLATVCYGCLLYFGQPKSMDGVVLGRILGTLDAVTVMVFSYYFGSSVGSKTKDTALANIAESTTT